MSHRSTLLWAMVSSVILVAVAMFLDEQREFENALSGLRDEQVALATAIGADFEARLENMQAESAPPGPHGHEVAGLFVRLLGGALELQQPSSRILLVNVPGVGLLTADGRSVHLQPLEEAMAAGLKALTLSRDEAASLGLPARMATVGIRINHEDPGWGVLVVASAERLRARERHAQLRLLLGIMVLIVLVATFGGLAVRDQRRRLEAARELEVAALRREAERLLANADKMATLAALSGGIAHQIATPLSTIIARVEQVGPAVRELPKATAALNVISEQVQRIQRIISGLLDLARGNRPTLVKTRPEAIVQATLSLVQHRLAEAHVEVVQSAEPNLPSIACDPPLLEQALANLVLNASDVSEPDGHIWLRLEHASGHVRFVVEDHGEGIREEVAGRATEPFFTTKAPGVGTGLGLAIAHEVVASHAGKLSLRPRENQPGSVAVMEIPASLD